MVENASTVTMASNGRRSLRFFICQALGRNSDRNRLGKAVNGFLVVLILFSILAVVMESIPAFHVRYEAWFFWIDVVTISLFTIEYFLRVWIAGEEWIPTDRVTNRWLARLRYAITPYALIDLIAILPFYLVAFGIIGSVDMRFLRAVRLLRILKLSRYSPAFDMLVGCFRDNGRSLGAAFFVLLVVMLLAASGMYYFEHKSQPVAFNSIPASMWWALVTLTTVGYGDVTPVTLGGKIFGALVTIVGIGMVALPTGILASGFAEQVRLRSGRYELEAEQALDDGVLSQDELSDLENLRKDLGLDKHTASQILDMKLIKSALQNDSTGHKCPRCGLSLDL